MLSLFSYWPTLLQGFSLTCLLMCVSLLAGLVLALLFTAGSLANNFFLRKSLDGLVFFIRGTPLLIQFFLIYYGLAQFELIRLSFLWPFLREPFACAVLALSLNSACYTTVILQAALRAIPENEVSACTALGMSKWLAYRRIIFPRALRFALPAYGNEVIMLLKSTSLASAITLLDLMGVTQQLLAKTYEAVELYLLVGLIYLLLYGCINFIFKKLTARFNLCLHYGA